MPRPEDNLLCLGHPYGHEPGKRPTSWCERYRDCARHQTISEAEFDGTFTVAKRACASKGGFEAFLPVDRSSEGGAE